MTERVIVAKEVKEKKINKLIGADNPTLAGFKWGFGFWLAALAVFVLLSVVFLLLSYVL